jgi:hypothetical protein
LLARAQNGLSSRVWTLAGTKGIAPLDAVNRDHVLLGSVTGKARVHGTATGAAILSGNWQTTGPTVDDPVYPGWRLTAGGTADQVTLTRLATTGGAQLAALRIDNTGRATIGADPTGALDVATKQYVDGKTAAVVQGTVNGGTAVTTTETVLLELTPTFAAGRWTLIVAQVPVTLVNATASVTMQVRSGGTAGVADGSVLLAEIRVGAIAAGQVSLMVAGFTLVNTALARLKLTASINTGTANTDWTGRLVAVQLG